MARKRKTSPAPRRKKTSADILNLPKGWERHTISEIEDMGKALPGSQEQQSLKHVQRSVTSSVDKDGTQETGLAPKKPRRQPKVTATPAVAPISTEEPSAQPIPKKHSLLFHWKHTQEEVPAKKQQSSMRDFFASINNIGMGKNAHIFVQSAATMLEAGLPLIETLKIFQMETRGRSMRKIIQQMIEEVENGTPFWQAMENRRLFSPYDIAMVHIGEEAGNLARNMTYLAEQKEKDRQLKQKVKMAMIYPTVVLVMMFIVIMGLGLFVLPNLVQVLFALNAELPITTKIVIWISQMFSLHGKVFVPLLVAFLVFFFLLMKFTPLRIVGQWLVFHIPGVGKLAREATIARFGVILGGLLQAGVPFVVALESLVEVTPTVAYKKFYAKLLEHVRVGDSFSKGFEELKQSRKLLPVSVQQLVVTGERSGSLAESLLKVASIYEKRASETAQVLPVILEPMLLLIIGGLVAFIALAIIVPIYSVVGNIGNA